MTLEHVTSQKLHSDMKADDTIKVDVIEDEKVEFGEWTDFRKTPHLIIITKSAVVPDFDSGIGTASIFGLAQTYDTDLGWSIFLLGWGGIFCVMLMRRYGRLPVIFWSQRFAFAFLIGATLAQNLATFAARVRLVIGMFFIAVPMTQLKGSYFRARYAL
ncbi:hypothetical protein C8R48DRAFT_678305 [Suillus tomentosus]|nr:hypothetical protein C8R48DRAFT_678305 [Suillus tomentosus]